MLSATMEDYLKATFHLQQESDARVRTSDLAEYMDVESSTVTNMVKKLSERDLVHYEPYKGIKLTETGTPIALEVIRHHRLLERYLTDYLEYDWSEVHDEADRLEHHISDQFAERVADLLGDPDVDPHGDPIPTGELDVSSPQSRKTLGDYREGDAITIERVRDREPTVLEYLSDHGIEPGVTVEIVEVTRFGMVTVCPNEKEKSVALPEEIAESVYARPHDGDGD